jgi:hypothetical protein
MNATKQRFKTWDATIEALEKLEAGAGDNTQLKAQITSLTAELAARNAEIKTLKSAGSSQQNAPAAPANPPVDQRPLASLSKVELANAMDAANDKGDKPLTDKLWREYSSRK